MQDVWQTLRTALWGGHRQLADGLSRMIASIQCGDYAQAAQLAEDVDRDSGPHVEFEERYILPAVERESGEAIATKLYDDLAEVLITLLELRELAATPPPNRQTKQRWLLGLEKGLAHLAATGEFVQRLRFAPADEKQRLLRRYRKLRERPHRWSQLHPAAHFRESFRDPPATGLT